MSFGAPVVLLEAEIDLLSGAVLFLVDLALTETFLELAFLALALAFDDDFLLAVVRGAAFLETAFFDFELAFVDRLVDFFLAVEPLALEPFLVPLFLAPL